MTTVDVLDAVLGCRVAADGGFQSSHAQLFHRYLTTLDLVDVKIMWRRANARFETIGVEVATGRPQRAPVDIKRIEPLAIVFPIIDGRPGVFALRPDFPDTPHQNFAPDWCAASLCIDDQPWVEARLTFTPADFLAQVQSWFRKAALDELHETGRALDPLFVSPGPDLIVPLEILSANPDESRPLAIYRQNQDGLQALFLERAESGKQALHEFVVLRADAQQMLRLRRMPQTLSALHDELRDRGVDVIGSLKQHVKLIFRDLPGGSDRHSNRLVFLLEIVTTSAGAVRVDRYGFLATATIAEIGVALGLLHGLPGKPETVGWALAPSAPDDEALEKLELLSCPVQRAFDAQLAQELSGSSTNAVKTIAVVGVGAIGSQVVEHLVREGCGSEFYLIDPDILLPHNLARHSLTGDDIGCDKARNVANRLRSIRRGLKVQGLSANILSDKFPDELKSSLTSADLIVDATASIAAARCISDLPGGARRASVFFNPAGTGVVVLMEDEARQQDLRRLEAIFYRELLLKSELSAFVATPPERLAYSGSCRELTNRIPASRAAMLSALAAEELQSALRRTGSTIAIWDLKDNELKRFTASVPAPLHQVIPDADDRKEWRIIGDGYIDQRLRELRDESLPAETGGVIVGVVDMAAKRLDLVDITAAPPGSKGSKSGFIRGTVGLASWLEKVSTTTVGHVRYLGEWHSHPRHMSTAPSVTDLMQIGWLADTLQLEGYPALMIICGDRATGAYLASAVEPK